MLTVHNNLSVGGSSWISISRCVYSCSSFFDDETTADKAAEMGQAMLAARSLRLTEIAAKMHDSSAASYKRIQRFLRGVDPRAML